EVEAEHAGQVVPAGAHPLAVEERVHPPLLVGVERPARDTAAQAPAEGPEPEAPPLRLRPVPVHARVVLAGRPRGLVVRDVAEGGAPVHDPRPGAGGGELGGWLHGGGEGRGGPRTPGASLALSRGPPASSPASSAW